QDLEAIDAAAVSVLEGLQTAAREAALRALRAPDTGQAGAQLIAMVGVSVERQAVSSTCLRVQMRAGSPSIAELLNDPVPGCEDMLWETADSCGVTVPLGSASAQPPAIVTLEQALTGSYRRAVLEFRLRLEAAAPVEA